MLKKISLSALVNLLFSLCVLSRVSAQDTIQLEDIIVTPYKTSVTKSLNPASMDKISVEEANTKGIFTLSETLKNQSSISYTLTGGTGGISGISIRGAETSHTQVIFDEVRLYDPIVTAGYFYAFNYMSLDNLENIEVVRGPYSSLYGSDSIGGTIRLLPRKGKGKPEISYLQEFGSYQTTREKLSGNGQIDKLAYSFSISKQDINNFYSGKYTDGNYETDPYHGLNSSLRLDYDISDSITIGLIGDYTYAKYEYDGWNGSDDNDNYGYFHQGIGELKLKHQLNNKFSYKTILGYTRTYRKDWESATTNDWYNGKTYQAKWQGNYNLFDFNTIVFGFDYLREAGESIYANAFFPSTTPKITSNTKGYYLENIFNPWDNLFLSAAYRIEEHSAYNSHNTFNLSASYKIKKTNTKLKASFGEGFKAPSLYQLYDATSGNLNLSPEESKSYDIGFEQFMGKKLTFGSTFFHTDIKEAIDWVSTGFFVGQYKNIGKSEIWGLENFLKYSFNENTNIDISYTYMNTEDKSDGSRLLRRPDNKITLNFNTKIKKLKIYSDISYVGNRADSSGGKLDSYVLGNLSFNYKINEKFNTFLRFENIFDSDYELVNGYQTPEFSWYLGAKYTF